MIIKAGIEIEAEFNSEVLKNIQVGLRHDSSKSVRFGKYYHTEHDGSLKLHKFTKNGKGYEIGKTELGTPKYAQTYVCVHCYQEYVKEMQSPPPNPCPARRTSREMKRILR